MADDDPDQVDDFGAPKRPGSFFMLPAQASREQLSSEPLLVAPARQGCRRGVHGCSASCVACGVTFALMMGGLIMYFVLRPR